MAKLITVTGGGVADGEQIPLVVSDAVPRGFTANEVGAAQLDYTPSDPDDWPATPPTTIQGALDVLAEPRVNLRTNLGIIGPGTPVNFSTSLTPSKTGLFSVQVWVVLDIANAALDTLIYSLEAGAPAQQLFSAAIGVPANIGTISIYGTGLVQLPDTGLQLFSLDIASSGLNNITIGGGDARMLITEY